MAVSDGVLRVISLRTGLGICHRASAQGLRSEVNCTYGWHMGASSGAAQLAAWIVAGFAQQSTFSAIGGVLLNLRAASTRLCLPERR
jgi:hypothetical protein